MTSSILAACERRGDAEEFDHASSVADSLAPSNGQLESRRDLFGEDGAARRTLYRANLRYISGGSGGMPILAWKTGERWILNCKATSLPCSTPAQPHVQTCQCGRPPSSVSCTPCCLVLCIALAREFCGTSVQWSTRLSTPTRPAASSASNRPRSYSALARTSRGARQPWRPLNRMTWHLPLQRP